MSGKIDIVITTWKREWMMENCLTALQKNTRTPYRLIIIDNGSDKLSSTSYLNTADIYVKLDQNYGLEYAKNLGMRFVESPLFISMDNDIMVYNYTGADWLARLIDLMTKYPSYAAIALKPQVLVGTSMAMFDTPDELVPFGHVPGYGRLMRTDVIKQTGAWNERRPLRGHEELWIGEKLSQSGWKMGWANQIGCWHLFGKEDTDEWGYPKGAKPEDHGHNPVWPMPKNDIAEIKRKVGTWVTL